MVQVDFAKQTNFVKTDFNLLHWCVCEMRLWSCMRVLYHVRADINPAIPCIICYCLETFSLFSYLQAHIESETTHLFQFITINNIHTHTHSLSRQHKQNLSQIQAQK